MAFYEVGNQNTWPGGWGRKGRKKRGNKKKNRKTTVIFLVQTRGKRKRLMGGSHLFVWLNAREVKTPLYEGDGGKKKGNVEKEMKGGKNDLLARGLVPAPYGFPTPIILKLWYPLPPALLLP
jgi:hypothetical protein